jgi:hypothetical protein
MSLVSLQTDDVQSVDKTESGDTINQYVRPRENLVA